MGRKKKAKPDDSRAEQDWLSWESEWLSRNHPEPLCKLLGSLEFRARLPVSDRRWRVFLVACLRHVGPVVVAEWARGMVEAVEEWADRVITEEEFERLYELAADPPNADAVGPEVCPPNRREGCAVRALAFA